jgi:beta-lactamase class A
VSPVAAPPPPVVAPAAVVYGRIAVRVGPRTTRVRVLADGRPGRARRVARGPRRVSVPLPVGRWSVRVRATGPGGSATSAARTVWVLPRSGARQGTTDGRLDRRLQGDLARLAGAMPAVTGAYAQHLVTGCGAAVNARATFPAASTLKSAILLDAVRRPRGAPPALLDEMIVNSNDLAANRVLAIQGGGDGVAGAASVTETMRAVGLRDALVRRPYIVEAQERRRIPVTTTAQPALFTNFIAGPYELARLFVSLHRATLGGGAVHRLGIGTARARSEMWRRLLEVRDRTKLVAGVPAGVPVAHKTGYTTEVKHDVGVVYLPSGPVVVAAMSWSAGGVSDAVGDRYIADVARAAVARLSGGGRCR